MTDVPSPAHLTGHRSPSTKPALRLAGLLGGAGVVHLVRPAVFDDIVPERLPGSARFYTYASGVAELALALALVFPRTRRLGAGLSALFFLAVFPANIKMTVDDLRSPAVSPGRKVAVVARLPLQLPMVRAALSLRRAA